MQKKLFRLTVGLMIVSLGIAVSLKAHLGFAPWEVFHSGLSQLSHISIGRISIITSLVIITLSLFVGVQPGIGTLLNMVLVGIFVDAFMLIPFELYFINIYIKLLALLVSVFLLAVGSYLYIGAGLGTGPRDALTVLMAQKTSLHMGTCKALFDALVLTMGFFLGGSVGIGTIINVLLLGFMIKVVFSFFDFDATNIVHMSFSDIFKKPVYIEIAKDDLLD